MTLSLWNLKILQPFLGRAQMWWNQIDEDDSRGLHCVKHTSEKKGPSLGKLQSHNSSSAKSLRFEIWRQIYRKDCETLAMCLRRCAGTCQENLQEAQRGGQSCILFGLWGVYFACRIHSKLRGKRFCGRFQASVHIVRKKDFDSRTGDGEFFEKIRRWWWQPTAKH